jgi:hypothetical protein
MIHETLEKWGIYMKMHPICRENTLSGLRTQIKEHSPCTKYFPCCSHSLNLVGNATAESPHTAISIF